MTSLNSYFAEIHCINLDRRPDRWEESIKEFDKHRLTVKRYKAFDGKELPLVPGLTPGNIGATYSHRGIIQKAKDNNYDNILILEDDVEFHNDLNSLFSEYIKEVPNDWDIIFFGGNHCLNNGYYMHDPIIPITEHVYRVIRSFANHCYAVKNTCYDKLIEVLSSTESKPNDVLVSDIKKELNCYLFRPHLAWQRPSYSDLNEKFENYEFLKK
jgi:GR25 family glycosyltransferase involved in LPS biosynthesis